MPAPTGSGALPAAHRGSVRPDRARPGQQRRLLGGPRQGRAAHPYGTRDRRTRTPAGATRRSPPTRTSRSRVFAWRITETVDLFGNLIRYDYVRDRGDGPGHAGTSRCSAGSATPTTATGADPSFLVARRVRLRAAARPVLRPPRRVRDPHLAALPGDPGRHPRRGRRRPGRRASTGSATSRRRSTGSRC